MSSYYDFFIYIFGRDKIYQNVENHGPFVMEWCFLFDNRQVSLEALYILVNNQRE